MELGLEGKTALITGGCHGIGLAISKALKEEGVSVTSICRHTGFDSEDISTYPKTCLYDILINNVGGGGRWTLAEWPRVHTKNAHPMARLMSLALPFMEDQTWGRVVTISSVFGKEAGGSPGFTATKAFQVAWMKSFAIQPRFKGITFNTVCPGGIEIPGKPIDDLPEPHGQPEDVANIVTFLCSDKAKFINGATIVVDGGFSRSF